MTTGAIFARGSCRALKWLALFGVVFALAAGQAAAQAPVLKVEGVSAEAVKLTWTYSGGPAPINRSGEHGAFWITQHAAATSVLNDDPETPGESFGDVTDANANTRMADITTRVAATTANVYRVAAVTTNGYVWSNQVVFQTETPPGPPRSLEVAVKDKMATLSWQAPAAGGGPVNHYEYNFKAGSDVATAISPTDRSWKDVPGGGSARSVPITTGLENGKSYVFSVRSVNNGGAAAVIPQVAAIPSTVPDMPTEVVATPGTPVSGKVHVDLTWMAPASDGGNIIKYYEYKYGSKDWVSTVSPVTSVRIAGVDAAMAGDYTYSVRAVNDNGAGPIGDSMGGTGGTGPGPGTTPAGPTDGRIFGITIGNFDNEVVELKRIGGVRRAHVGEGTVHRALVRVEWSNKMVTDLWNQANPNGGSSVRPPDATVDLVVVSVVDPATWLSPAENDEKPGLSNLSGYDVSLGAGHGGSNKVTIEVPGRPRQNPNSEAHSAYGLGWTTLSLNPDSDAEDEAFTIRTVAGSGNGVYLGNGPLGASRDRMDNDTATTAIVDIAVIEDDEDQGVKLTRDPKTANPSAVFEGQSVKFMAVADPPREDLPLQVRYHVTDLDEVSVSSREYTLDSAVGNIPVGAGPAAKHNVTFSTPGNDGNREDVDLTLHAEVISYDLGSGAFDDIQSDTQTFPVFDIHKLPVLDDGMVTPSASTVEEGETFTLKVEIDRNPANTRRVTSEHVSDYTLEAVTVMFSTGDGSAGDKDYEIMTNPVTFPRVTTPGVQMMEVEVMALEDADLDDMEMLVLDVEINGTVDSYGPNTDMDMYPGAVSVTIEDATAKTVSAKTQEEVEAAVTAAGLDEALTVGDAVMIMGSAVFDVMPGASVIYS
ncbi:MAG: fibronectin type III domain-containing protein, partial [Gemmatimonadetes bacterium]|nr:fibronectin type III domain-containing protein [Gemmatimonadota bacterium]